MSTSGAAARWIQVVLTMLIAALVVLAGLGLVTISVEGSSKAQADRGEATPLSTTVAVATPTTPAPAGTPSTTSVERLFGPDRRDPRTLVVFMQPVATAAEIDAVKRSLAGMTDVGSVRFVDHAEAYEEMKALYARTPEVMKSLRREDAPVSFHVLPRPNVDRHVIGARLARLPGIITIVYPGE